MYVYMYICIYICVYAYAYVCVCIPYSVKYNGQALTLWRPSLCIHRLVCRSVLYV